MERTKPTPELIYGIGGGNFGLLKTIYYGLQEVPLREIYPALNLDDACAFSAASWLIRDRSHSSFSKFVEKAELYDIFKQVNKARLPSPALQKYDNIYHWINFNKKIPGELKAEYESMNPFGSAKNLEQRLSVIEDKNPESVARLKDNLRERTRSYAFSDAEYYEKGGSNSGVIKLEFKRNSGELALRISNLIRCYPREHIRISRE